MGMLDYYARPGVMTGAGPHAALLEGLPVGVPALVRAVQGLLLHIFWAESLDVTLTEERKQEVNLRAVSRQLARLQELSAAPLAEPRPPENKLVGNCRDFAVLLCAFLRHQGVPARARCGFGGYFTPGQYEDHWVCEVWDAGERRWRLVDAQLDAFQREVLGISFDPLDVPRDQFLSGARAWHLCRTGQADPERFGIFDMHGLWFVRGDLVRDFLAHNKVEILPWDSWNDTMSMKNDLSGEEMAWFDTLAALILGGDGVFPRLRRLYQSDPRLHRFAASPSLRSSALDDGMESLPKVGTVRR